MNIIDYLTRLFEKRSDGRPTTKITQETLLELLGGSKSVTGKSVNPSTAMQISAVYACVRVISETIATLPLITYRRLERGKVRAPEHSLYPILHDIPNPEMTSVELREAIQGHVLLWGNGYCEVLRDGAGRVKEIWPLRPDRMQLVRNSRNELIYVFTLSSGEPRRLRADRVLHIRGLTFEGLMGYDPLKIGKETMGMAMAAEEYGGRFYSNDARPGGVLEHPGQISEDASKRLIKSWNSMHSGLDNAHRVALLEEGLKWHQVGISPENAQFLETRKFQTNEILRFFRMQPHKVGELDRATWGNIEHQAIEHVTDTLRPWLVRWEKAILKTLFTEEERKVYFSEFLIDGLLRGDIKTRYSAYAIARQNGWMNANEIRELENMNPYDGGDEYLVNAAMKEASEVEVEA
jgi:HK97 family phage portal protein